MLTTIVNSGKKIERLREVGMLTWIYHVRLPAAYRRGQILHEERPCYTMTSLYSNNDISILLKKEFMTICLGNCVFGKGGYPNVSSTIGHWI